jgi:hypothetical protein
LGTCWNEQCLKRGPQALLNAVWSERFVGLRATFSQIADQCNAGATAVPVDAPLLASLEQYRDQCNDAGAAGADPDDPFSRIETRQHKAFALWHGTLQEKAQFIKLALDQIGDYAALTRQVLETLRAGQ